MLDMAERTTEGGTMSTSHETTPEALAKLPRLEPIRTAELVPKRPGRLARLGRWLVDTYTRPTMTTTNNPYEWNSPYR